MSRLSLIIPLAIFGVILAISMVAFSLGDRHELPSPLVGKPFPEFAATDLFAPEKILTKSDLVGRPTLVNVWATWCPTCVSEHKTLLEIAATGKVRLVGIDYKDTRAQALGWLSDYGNPYDLVIEDQDGALGIELGFYGAPETFLLNATGDVLYKRVGDVNSRIWTNEILPRLEAMAAVQ
jgi:cytochrome c biogenesis protein CcmG/thiol:disulfide interchange protein DsbE